MCMYVCISLFSVLVFYLVDMYVCMYVCVYALFSWSILPLVNSEYSNEAGYLLLLSQVSDKGYMLMVIGLLRFN